MKIKSLIILLLLAFNAYAEDLGLVFGQSTRVILNLDENATKLVVSNYSEKDYLVQAIIIESDDETLLSSNLMVIPEVFKIEANRTKSLVIRRLGGVFPEDRESLLYVVGKFIPTAAQDLKSQLELIFSFKQKVFIRPPKLKAVDAVSESRNKIDIRYEDGSVIIKNNSCYHLTFHSLYIDDKKVHVDNSIKMLKPFSTQSFKYSEKPKKIRWSFISDSGYETAQSERKFI